MEIDFKKRNNTRIAEEKGEQWMNKHNYPFIRYGMDSLDSGLKIWKIPIFVRSAPDYIMFKNEYNPSFLEVKGFVNTIRLKSRDLREYWTWNTHLPITMLLYNITSNKYCEVLYKDIVDIVTTKKPKVGSYPENVNNKFYEIKEEWLPDFID